MSLSRLPPETTRYITHHIFGSTRSILMGSSLAYAVQKENYLHFPLIILFPLVYTGYHMYNNKEVIKEWLWI
jgi:hypothetical protein